MDSALKMNSCSLGVGASYDVKDSMTNGVTTGRPIDTLNASHPLEQSLPKHTAKQTEVSMNMLTRIQGLHAPLRLAMEKKAVQNTGHLPCLFRHNAMLDALTGRDMDLEFEDFLNTPLDAEKMGTPHMVIEKHFGIL
nr:EOG090X0J8E [Sida crystallina]